ncbi:hypothetical protein E0Z10_g8873 [Xylaria hypoxylon]|uniref:Endo-1,3(4)-beta-glucanase 1 carbohydrate binding domain-containing protein n=1 Tax=Xylaria hypoxylon TaxID=37992 RepID=A0A4Z0YQN6_9PEZI|nr:hypothetical protein E0Z10_g8873 [Xylaria hypoxylon]
MKIAFLLALSSIAGFTNAVTQAPKPHALQQRTCTPFISAMTRLSICCEETTHYITWFNKALRQGICCPNGRILNGFICEVPPPKFNGGVCTGDFVCPDDRGMDVGIKYGHCYVLQALGGLYIGHDHAAKYEVQGENPGVVFRVCGDTAACNTTPDVFVKLNDSWWMQDQMGNSAGTGFGWLGGSGDLSVQDSPETALTVGGSPICYGGKCAICITFPPGGAHAPKPSSPGQTHLGISSNPNNCQSFFWQEVGCRSEK